MFVQVSSNTEKTGSLYFNMFTKILVIRYLLCNFTNTLNPFSGTRCPLSHLDTSLNYMGSNSLFADVHPWSHPSPCLGLSHPSLGHSSMKLPDFLWILDNFEPVMRGSINAFPQGREERSLPGTLHILMPIPYRKGQW